MLLALVSAWCLHLAAADPQAQTRTISVTVTDEKGVAPVEGLTPQEIIVLEDGVPRGVTHAEPDGGPLTLAVVVDSSAPMASLYRLDVVPAIVGFLNRLPEGWRAAIWTTGDRPIKILDTADPAEASRALKRVFPTGGNTLLDALVEASRELRTKEGARAVVVAVTGAGVGFANRQRRRVIEEAQAGGALFMAVQFEDEGSPEVRGDGIDQVGRNDYDQVLASLTRATGGLHERILSSSGVAGALEKIAAALKGRYTLTFAGAAEPDAKPSKKKPKIEVQVARQGVRVRVSQPTDNP
jgi:VWFA-related protein